MTDSPSGPTATGWRWTIALGILLVILIECVLATGSWAVPVGGIDIEGADTDPAVIRQLLDTKEGQEFYPAVWGEDIRRLRNTELFYGISSESRAEEGVQRLRLHLRNKFSLIPIVKYRQGGGTSLATLGAYDVNVRNRLLEVGAQYENMNGKHGGVAWFRHPYAFSRKNNLGADVFVHTINLPLLTIDGAQEANVDDREFRWNGRFLREWTPSVRAGTWISLYRNTLVLDNSTPEKAQRNAGFLSQQALNSGLTVSLLPRIIWGRIDKEGVYVDGSEITAQGEFAHSALGSDFSFATGEVHWNAGFRPLEHLNVASQFRIGTKTGGEFQHKFYLGGLESLRGFIDGQFRGNHYWLANLEIRPTLVEKPLWVLQGNLFTDWGKTWDTTGFSLSEGFQRPYVSYGTGVRLILPRVYRALLRVDLARTQEPVKQFGLSFGLQQFF